jgi:SAM-dependent methyltransferase
MKYAVDVTKATLLSRAQDFGILYDRKYDTRNCAGSPPLYQVKWGYESPHTVALDLVPRGSRVLDVGCADGHIAEALADRGCEVTGVDQYPPVNRAGFARFIQADLNRGDLPLDTGKFQYILLLDIIEHLVSPEKFVDWLRRSRRSGDETKLIVSTGNIGFAIPRLMLLLGNFNYSSRGILDLTHTRLFTFATLRNLFLQAGYRIELERGIPAPFPLAFGDSRLARFLLAVNRFLIRISKGWFSYQIFMVVRPMPTLEYLLQAAKDTAADKAAQAN